MRIVFLSNYYNHHQSAFSELMYKKLDGEYFFVAYEKVNPERVAMGWMSCNFPTFVHQYSNEQTYCDELINNSDVVILGSAPYRLVLPRLRNHKLTFSYCERIDKCKPSFFNFAKSFLISNFNNIFARDYYYLCASAFTAYDFSKRISTKDRFYNWGYFPRVIKYANFSEILSSKNCKDNCVSILFVSRFIDWKHPELPVLVAKRLKEENISFHLTMIGIGNMEKTIIEMINDYGLQNEVSHIKSLSPEEVRTYMEKSSIYLFTSDRNEGWGAVLNEAMNSGCAVVASSQIGAVPLLLKDGVNGYIFQDGNFDDLLFKVKDLCLSQKKRELLGTEAYKTIIETWNAEVAADRLLSLIDDLKSKKVPNRFIEGPCSKANILRDGWYTL